MSNAQKVLSKFVITDENLQSDPDVYSVFDAYSDKRFEFGEARRALNESIRALHERLDGPLRAAGLIPEGKDWTLTEDDKDGLLVQVWSEPKSRRGRRKPEIPVRQVALLKNNKAA